MRVSILQRIRRVLAEGNGHGGYRHGKRKEPKDASGNRTFSEYGAWRAACRMAPGFARFEGDDEGCEVIYHPGPRGKDCSGSWNGTSGTLISSGMAGSTDIRAFFDQKRRRLTEDPDYGYDEWHAGYSFLFHPRYGYLESETTGVSHYELMRNFLSGKFAGMSHKDLDDMAELDLMDCKWTGRYWTDEMDQYYVSFWEQLGSVIDEFVDVTSMPNPAYAMYEYQSGWLDWDAVQDLPKMPKFYEPSDGKSMIRLLQAEIHTASPFRKQQIRASLAALGQGLGTENPKSEGGFRSEAERRYAMGESRGT